MKIKTTRTEKGQSLVEFALTATLLAFVMLAVLDFGLAFFAWITLRDAAQEGATYGAVYPPVDPNAVRGLNEVYGYSLPYIRARVRFSADAPINLINIPNSNIVITLLKPDGTPGGAPCPGNAINVRVTYYYQIVGPLISEFIGSPTIPVSAAVTDTILMNGNNAVCH